MLRSSTQQLGFACLLGAFALAACDFDPPRKRSSDDDDGGSGGATTIGAGGSIIIGGGGSTTGVGGGATTVGAGGSPDTTTTTTGAGGCNHAFDLPPSACVDCVEAMCCAEITACGNDGVCSACLMGQQTTGCDQNGALLDLSDCMYAYCSADCG